MVILILYVMGSWTFVWQLVLFMIILTTTTSPSLEGGSIPQLVRHPSMESKPKKPVRKGRWSQKKSFVYPNSYHHCPGNESLGPILWYTFCLLFPRCRLSRARQTFCDWPSSWWTSTASRPSATSCTHDVCTSAETQKDGSFYKCENFFLFYQLRLCLTPVKICGCKMSQEN